VRFDGGFERIEYETATGKSNRLAAETGAGHFCGASAEAISWTWVLKIRLWPLLMTNIDSGGAALV
jgi:hypothetical protein